MAQQVHLRAGLGLPLADPAAESTPRHPVHELLDFPEGFASQMRQIGAAEPATGRGEQPGQVPLCGCAVQQVAQFPLRQRLDVLQMWTALELAWGGIAPAGRPAEPRVVRGETGEVLVASASEPGDLLVIGTGRRGAMRRLCSSRVTRYILGHAGCPVVAVPPAELEHAAGHGLRGWAFRHRALSVSPPA